MNAVRRSKMVTAKAMGMLMIGLNWVTEKKVRVLLRAYLDCYS